MVKLMVVVVVRMQTEIQESEKPLFYLMSSIDLPDAPACTFP